MYMRVWYKKTRRVNVLDDDGEIPQGFSERKGKSLLMDNPFPVSLLCFTCITNPVNYGVSETFANEMKLLEYTVSLCVRIFARKTDEAYDTPRPLTLDDILRFLIYNPLSATAQWG